MLGLQGCTLRKQRRPLGLLQSAQVHLPFWPIILSLHLSLRWCARHPHLLAVVRFSCKATSFQVRGPKAVDVVDAAANIWLELSGPSSTGRYAHLPGQHLGVSEWKSQVQRTPPLLLDCCSSLLLPVSSEQGGLGCAFQLAWGMPCFPKHSPQL